MHCVRRIISIVSMCCATSWRPMSDLWVFVCGVFISTDKWGCIPWTTGANAKHNGTGGYGKRKQQESSCLIKHCSLFSSCLSESRRGIWKIEVYKLTQQQRNFLRFCMTNVFVLMQSAIWDISSYVHKWNTVIVLPCSQKVPMWLSENLGTLNRKELYTFVKVGFWFWDSYSFSHLSQQNFK